MYLIAVMSVPSSRRWRCEETTHLFQILRRVDADRVVRGLHRFDADAVFQGPQLFERLGALEWRLVERRHDEQGAAAIGVQTDVLVEGGPSAARIPRVGNGRSRKIQREPSTIEDELDDIGVRQLSRVVDPAVEGGD